MTYGAKLLIVVQGLWGLCLNGRDVQRGPEGDRKEQGRQFWQLLQHGRHADALQVEAFDVVEAVDLPEIPLRLRGIRMARSGLHIQEKL